MENREALLKEDDQSLATHTKRRRSQPKFKKGNHRESQPPRKFQKTKESLSNKDYSSFQCFHCDKIGHIARNCPLKRQEYKKRNYNKKRHHAHLAEDEDEVEEEEGPRESKQEKKMQKSMYYSRK